MITIEYKAGDHFGTGFAKVSRHITSLLAGLRQTWGTTRTRANISPQALPTSALNPLQARRASSPVCDVSPLNA